MKTEPPYSELGRCFWQKMAQGWKGFTERMRDEYLVTRIRKYEELLAHYKQRVAKYEELLKGMESRLKVAEAEGKLPPPDELEQYISGEFKEVIGKYQRELKELKSYIAKLIEVHLLESDLLQSFNRIVLATSIFDLAAARLAQESEEGAHIDASLIDELSQTKVEGEKEIAIFKSKAHRYLDLLLEVEPFFEKVGAHITEKRETVRQILAIVESIPEG